MPETEIGFSSATVSSCFGIVGAVFVFAGGIVEGCVDGWVFSSKLPKAVVDWL